MPVIVNAEAFTAVTQQAGQLTYQISWIERSATVDTRRCTQGVIDGQQTVQLTPPCPFGYDQELEFVAVINSDELTQILQFGKFNTAGQFFPITPRTTLEPQESLIFVLGAGFQVYDANGLTKQEAQGITGPAGPEGPTGPAGPTGPSGTGSEQTDVPTSGGFTVNIANGVGFELIVPVAGAVNSSGNTVNFPGSPTSLQGLVVFSKSALAGVTFSGGGNSVVNAPTSMTANQAYGFQYIGGEWVRLY